MLPGLVVDEASLLSVYQGRYALTVAGTYLAVKRKTNCVWPLESYALNPIELDLV